ncbi:uncharacterized protein LOC129589531 isoform X1 [Paramacrobiotus metropolitanus]|uniref:uncharacterized protein LOC129589531 isoform X1 n=1 Tax=Paramacrobiotus metropolitanus TaxID=2943436 RepID=UPI002445915D|nr:uncharacterized protein LOC129589531 isoform X1 [Paramacrobiotus metropolitanus]
MPDTGICTGIYKRACIMPDTGICTSCAFLLTNQNEKVAGKLHYIYRRYVERFPDAEPPLSEKANSFLKELRMTVTDSADEGIKLPAELWAEVFSHLTTLTQTALRAVCATWDRILDASALRSNIFIRYETSPERRFGCFLHLAAVYKRLNPGTQRVALRSFEDGSWTLSDYAMMVFGMIRYVADHQSGIRLRTVHLRRVRLDLIFDCGLDKTHAAECGLAMTKPKVEFKGFWWLEDFMAHCRRLPCDTLHITDCLVSLVWIRDSPTTTTTSFER